MAILYREDQSEIKFSQLILWENLIWKKMPAQIHKMIVSVIVKDICYSWLSFNPPYLVEGGLHTWGLYTHVGTNYQTKFV